MGDWVLPPGREENAEKKLPHLATPERLFP
jgi:hypothetical protein